MRKEDGITNKEDADYVDSTKNAFRSENMYQQSQPNKDKEGCWMSYICINWHHLDCRVMGCECDCHILTYGKSDKP